MRAIVVGADSGIGSTLTAFLTERGDQVYETTRRSDRMTPDRLLLDLADDTAASIPLPQADIAYVCAAICNLAECRADPDRARSINVTNTVKLARRLVSQGTRVILLSSNAVFDGRIPCMPTSVPPSPRSLYGIFKAAAETLILSLGHGASVLRLTKVLEPRNPLFTTWIDSLSQGKTINAFTDVSLAPVTLQDVMTALLAITKDTGGGIYHVSGAEDITYATVAKHLAKRIGANLNCINEIKAIESGIPAEDIFEFTSLDSSRIESLTGWRAPKSLYVIDTVYETAIRAVSNQRQTGGNTQMVDTFACLICGDGELEELEEFRTLPRVTSDCKPWPSGGMLAICKQCGGVQKVPNPIWHEEISRIYGAYSIYELSSGSEQVIFKESGHAEPRSRLLLDHVVQKANLPSEGALLDIGCGNGAALANFAGALPNWQLHGSELSDSSLPNLQRLTNFVSLHTKGLDVIDERFTLISMIHSLEHMPSPYETLIQAAKLLVNDGTFFIEVPDLESSPFDLLIADHLTHYSRMTLALLAARAGVNVSMISNAVLPKEITLLGHRGPSTKSHVDPREGIRIARTTLAWLQATFAVARELASRGPIGIFGTSIAGMAIYGAVKDHVSFFVDEDPTRIGKSYEGRKIIAPAEIPDNVPVFVALPPRIAEALITRLKKVSTHFVAPPMLDLTSNS